ncbi:hypothetical protein EW146_g1111 [Bondarzewia mesenterica]|uniref:RAI1-like domain-containing protein n=1 Tax=Bondarzewia mesenterica TaxID=1095465 RepID=A0A4S4M743_9AGAM|nr:hypothetical protein EW146_g1111 [Bondarzewia mesenterica]
MQRMSLVGGDEDEAALHLEPNAPHDGENDDDDGEIDDDEPGWEAPAAALLLEAQNFDPAPMDEDEVAELNRNARLEEEEDLWKDSHILPFWKGAAGAAVRNEGTSMYEEYHHTLSGLGEPTPNIWTPFISRTDWEVARWAKLRGPSSTAVSELLNIEGIHERLGLSYKTSKELNAIIDEKLPSRPQFKRQTIVVDGVPFDVYFRNIIQCIQALYGDPEFAPFLANAPIRVFTDEDKSNRIYHDVHTGNWWWEIQELLEASNAGATVIPIILSSDKTQLTLFRNKSAYPVYITIGNIPKEIRRKPSRRAQILLGYLPATGLKHIQHDDTRRRALSNLFHACMRKIVQPLKKYGKNGVAMADGYGVVRRGHPIFAAFVGDYPEQVLVAGCKTGECPKGSTKNEDLGNFGVPCELRNIGMVLEALASMDRGPEAFVKACKEAGIKPIHCPFWQGLPFANIYRAITPDILHQLYQGMLKHLISWLKDSFGEAEIDARARRMPPSHNVRLFINGISHLSRVSGAEHREICKILLGLIVDLRLRDGRSPIRIYRAVRALLDFLYLAQYPSHTDTTLGYLDDALKRFHANKDIFLEIGVREDFNLPKLHALVHYVASIKLLGTTDNFNTEYSERLHIDFTKDAYRATNHKDEYAQMTVWLQRKEKVLQHELFIRWRLAGERPIALNPPHIPRKLHSHIARFPNVKAARFTTLETAYGAIDFRVALARFIIQLREPYLSAQQVTRQATHLSQSFRFQSVPTFHKIKFWNADAQGRENVQETLDAALARPKYKDTQGRDVAGRFDTVLVNLGDGRDSGIEGYRVAQLRVIFSLPVRAARVLFPSNISPPKHLAYIEWFSPFDAVADGSHLMYKITRSFKNGRRHAAVISVDNIRRSIFLYPRFGPIAPRSWTSSHVLEECTTFYDASSSRRTHNCSVHKYDFDLRTGHSETGLKACVEVRTDPDDDVDKVWVAYSKVPKQNEAGMANVDTMQLPRMACDKPGAWDPQVNLAWGQDFLSWLRRSAQDQAGTSHRDARAQVWHVKFTPRSGVDMVLLDEAGVKEVEAGEERVGILPQWYWNELDDTQGSFGKSQGLRPLADSTTGTPSCLQAGAYDCMEPVALAFRLAAYSKHSSVIALAGRLAQHGGVERRATGGVVPSANPPAMLMEWAVLILNTADPTLKVERTRHAVHLFRIGKLKSIGNRAMTAPKPPDVPPHHDAYRRSTVTPSKAGKRKNGWACCMPWPTLSNGREHQPISIPNSLALYVLSGICRIDLVTVLNEASLNSQCEVESHLFADSMTGATAKSTPRNTGIAATRLFDFEPKKERWRSIARNCMITTHPFTTSRESVLWFGRPLRRARRPCGRPLCSPPRHAVYGNQLVDFAPTLARLLECLFIEDPQAHEWIMMVVINIGSFLEYGRSHSILLEHLGIIANGNEKMDVDNEETSPALSNASVPAEPSPVSKMASQLKIWHACTRFDGSCTSQRSQPLHHHLAQLLRYSIAATQGPYPSGVSGAWELLANFFAKVTRRVLKFGPTEPTLGSKTRLPEDWCIRSGEDKMEMEVEVLDEVEERRGDEMIEDDQDEEDKQRVSQRGGRMTGTRAHHRAGAPADGYPRRCAAQEMKVAELSDALALKKTLEESHMRTLHDYTEIQERHALLEASLQEHADQLLAQSLALKQKEADYSTAQAQLEGSNGHHAWQQVLQLEGDLTELRGELEARTSEVEMTRVRLAEVENSWAKSREEADVLHALTTTGLGDLLDTHQDLRTNEDCLTRRHTVKVQAMEVEEQRRAREGETEQMALRSQTIGLCAQLSNVLADSEQLRKDLAVRDTEVRQKAKEASDAELRLGMLRNYLAENDIVLDKDGLPASSSKDGVGIL